MARRQATEEQKANAEAKRARFKAVCAEIGRLSDDERAAIVAKVGAILNCEGRALSTFNACLIVSQRPTATIVGGFQQWQRVGRKIKKGATGIAIWIPAHTREADSGGPADASHDGEPIASGDDARAGKGRFFMGYVFDIGDTEPAEVAVAV